jgi:uncharacterized protein YpiB (UPF0302 family)
MMKKRNSYSELMKQASMNENVSEPVNVYVQMLLDEIIYKAKVNSLGKQIDQALDTRDCELFYKLSNDYNEILQK